MFCEKTTRQNGVEALRMAGSDGSDSDSHIALCASFLVSQRKMFFMPPTKTTTKQDAKN